MSDDLYSVQGVAPPKRDSGETYIPTIPFRENFFTKPEQRRAPRYRLARATECRSGCGNRDWLYSFGLHQHLIRSSALWVFLFPAEKRLAEAFPEAPARMMETIPLIAVHFELP